MYTILNTEGHVIKTLLQLVAVLLSCAGPALGYLAIDYYDSRCADGLTSYRLTIRLSEMKGDSDLGQITSGYAGMSLASLRPMTYTDTGRSYSLQTEMVVQTFRDIAGEWFLAFYTNGVLHRTLTFTLPEPPPADFPVHPPYPTLCHNDDPHQVLMPAISGALSAEGEKSSFLENGHWIYTFPTGGVFSASADSIVNKQPPAIRDTNDGSAYAITANMRLRSQSRLYFMVPLSTHLPHLWIEDGSVQQGKALWFGGLTTGSVYTLSQSTNLNQWTSIGVFTVDADTAVQPFFFGEEKIRFFRLIATVSE